MLRSMLLFSLLVVAACQTQPYAISGTSYPPPPPYGSPAAEYDAERGCASGLPADPLHQNRPGGSDFNPLRCREVGY